MKVKFREKFEKDIEDITNQNVLDDIASAIENVEKASKHQDITNIKKIQGTKNAYRIRIGRYRIGIYIVKDTVEFTRVLSRDKIYKRFPNKKDNIS
ncbi:MAG TPA: type II toxin-antitoxin system RelE/ParE family toxin [Salinivirgaceae bacterium]|nr:type II toxin-antitoxin system RelE/ParE family toxin [Salinivirgaceae bacterium]